MSILRYIFAAEFYFYFDEICDAIYTAQKIANKELRKITIYNELGHVRINQGSECHEGSKIEILPNIYDGKGGAVRPEYAAAIEEELLSSGYKRFLEDMVIKAQELANRTQDSVCVRVRDNGEIILHNIVGRLIVTVYPHYGGEDEILG
jgi:hypothetical protein